MSMYSTLQSDRVSPMTLRRLRQRQTERMQQTHGCILRTRHGEKSAEDESVTGDADGDGNEEGRREEDGNE